MATVKDILELIDRIAPFHLAEDWDNCGMQSGDMTWDVKRIMVALDISQKVMIAATKWQADAVVTHHPLLIAPVRVIDFKEPPGSIIGLSYKEKISIISSHTNLDKTREGLNDYLMNILGIEGTQPLIQDDSETGSGIGRIGSLKQGMIFSDLIEYVKKQLKLSALRVTGNESLKIEKIAVCTGSGGSLIQEFIKSGAQVFITGDVKYHEARLVEENELALIDIGHFSSEHIVVDMLTQRLAQAAATAGIELEIKGFREEKDPFTIM